MGEVFMCAGLGAVLGGTVVGMLVHLGEQGRLRNLRKEHNQELRRLAKEHGIFIVIEPEY